MVGTEPGGGELFNFEQVVVFGGVLYKTQIARLLRCLEQKVHQIML